MSPSRVARFLMSLAVLVLFTWRAAAADLKLNLRSHPKVAEAIPSELELLAVRTDGGGKKPGRVTARAGFPGTITIAIEVGSWSLSPSSEAVWAEPLEVELEEAGTEVDLHLWPTASVTSTLRVPRGERLPEGLRMRLRRTVDPPADALPQPEEGETDCLVKEDGRLSCTVPTGHWSLRLKAPDYAARYLWGVRIARGRENDLGVVELLKGTSLLGRVVTEDGPADSRTVKVRLRPVKDYTNASAERRQEINQLTLSTGINEHGYFGFYDAPPGEYVVVAEQEGYAPASMSPILLVEDEDTVLRDPILLRRPIRLLLAIDPAQEVYGGRWRVWLAQKRKLRMLDVVAEEEIESGIWESPPVTPGDYIVRILDSHDKEVFWEEVEIVYDQQLLPVELDLVLVSGEVLIGEKRLPSTLRFDRPSGPSRITTSTNDEGEFEVVLPGTGEWVVNVTSTEPQVKARGIWVDVERPKGSQPAHVVIKLDDTAVFGEVVDEGAVPVAGAVISVFGIEAPETRMVDARTDVEGRFELRGQQPAAYLFQATYGQRKSDIVTVNLIEGTDVGPVRLVLSDQKQVRGRVSSVAGPFSQALVMGFPLTPDRMPAAVEALQIRTEMDGSFELDWPANSLHGYVAVLAPGFDFYFGRVSADGADPVVIQLTREGGTLRLDGFPVWGSRAAQSTFGLVVIDGEPVNGALVEAWARMNDLPPAGDAPVVVPAMPSGSYIWCHLNPSEALAVSFGAALPKASACTEGYLSPGGELTLGDPSG